MTDTVIGLYTVDEFEDFIALPENHNKLLELIHGVIVEKMPTEEHGIIAATIARLLGNYVAPRKLGRVGVEVRHGKPTDKYNDRLPDVSFRRGNDPVVKKGAVPQMPDLAVEIQSPDDKVRDMREKAHYYLQNGSKLVWLVYPENKTIEVCTLNSNNELTMKTATIEDTLDGGDLLSEFTASVQEILEM